MAKADLYHYTYRVGRLIAYRGITSLPARRERELQRARPGGRLTIDGRANARERSLRAERRGHDHRRPRLTLALMQPLQAISSSRRSVQSQSYNPHIAHPRVTQNKD